MQSYNSLNEHFKSKYGCKVYKLALSLGTTCPNRDGRVGVGGCIFCANGSGDFAQKPSLDITHQIEEAKKLVKSKTRDNKYIAYFQSYTSTYVPFDKFKSAVLQAAAHRDTVGVSIATRPDCISDKILDFLSYVNKNLKPVTVELGFQTSNEKTAELINRCYSNDVFDKAVSDLRACGIETVAHIILGLPGENSGDMLETVRYISEKTRVDGVKLQLLHVLKGTRLCEMYENGEFEVLSLEEYTDILCKCISLLHRDIVIHRLTGDAPKKLLTAPLWSGDKKRVLNAVNAELKRRNIVQGRSCESRKHACIDFF